MKKLVLLASLIAVAGSAPAVAESKRDESAATGSWCWVWIPFPGHSGGFFERPCIGAQGHR